MNPHQVLPLVVSLACGLFAVSSAWAEPIEFSEVSLLLRAGESQPSIGREVAQRKLVHSLTSQQEATLKAQGARDSLIQTLIAPANVLAASEATAYEDRRTSRNNPPARSARHASSAGSGAEANDLHVFDVAVGHPINLSRWGGPDYDFAFFSPTRLDEGRDDAVIIDNVRSFTHAATYLGAGNPSDSTTIFSPSNYVSIVNHTFTRGVRIDRRNPVTRKGVPYVLYPVYAAGGVSLYYIGGTSDTVRVAVSTADY